MITALGSLVLGLVLLLWSADKFVEGASGVARYAGLSPLLIGILIVGFGTSAPELIVSVTAALNKSTSIAIGNAYGSNIVNIGLILGLTAVIKPVRVGSQVLKKELPILFSITLISFFLIMDCKISRQEAAVLLILFSVLMAWSFFQDKKKGVDNFDTEVKDSLSLTLPDLKQSVFFTVLGLAILIISSKLLVFGAVFLAKKAGISDLVIGLTIIALGTSLPELASSVAAAFKGKHDIALGNIIGSNLFNSLAVTGLAFLVHPSDFPKEVVTRDFIFMIFLTAMVFITGFGFKKPGKINRYEGFFLMCVYLLYLGTLVFFSGLNV
ncbi:MAG: calcium/sodium antiporter [Desulfobacteraceae bacterium]|nr:calcium/sodium antiporter [Desulfobacteraceae bacterium]